MTIATEPDVGLPDSSDTDKKPRRPNGTGRIFPRGKAGTLWIAFHKNGKRYFESTHSTKISRAEALLKKRLAEIENDTFISVKDRKVTIDELVTDLVSWYRDVRKKPEFADDVDARWTRHLKPFFGGMRAEQLSTDEMQKYRAKRTTEESETKKKAAQTTVNRELQILRKAFKRAASLKPPKVRNIPVFEMAEEDNARKVFMTEEIKQRLKDAAARDTSEKAKMKGLHLRTFVELVFTLGWRKSELTGLTVESVHLAEGFIRIEDSKSGEPREAPLTPTLRVLLEPLVIGKKPHEAIFPAKDLRCAWRRLCKNAGVKSGKLDGYVIHDTRRTAARTQRSAGVPESVSSKILGWKPGSKMYARYGIVDRADMNDALLRSQQWEQAQREAREAAETNWRHRAVLNEGTLPS